MVATGICDPRAETSVGSTCMGPTFWNPAGTVCKILIGYFPLEVTWCRQYSQAAMVNTITTKAFLMTEMKKKSRPETDTVKQITLGTQHRSNLLFEGYRLDNLSQMMRIA